MSQYIAGIPYHNQHGMLLLRETLTAGGARNMATAVRTEYRTIVVETTDRIAYVTMNRPERRNALSLEHMNELIVALKSIGSDPDIAVVIVRANGTVFSSGHDLHEMRGQSPEFYQHLFDVCTALMECVQSIPQPVIAQVQGIATAAGCQLVASCDLAVASEDARFATPGVKIGLFCSTPMVALSRAVGRKKALEMLLTGEFISAEEARAEGLVNKVVPPAELEAATLTMAQRIASASPQVVGIGKLAFYRQLDLPQHDAYAYAKDVMTRNASLDDAQEGIGAFLEKRTPQWTGTIVPNEG